MADELEAEIAAQDRYKAAVQRYAALRGSGTVAEGGAWILVEAAMREARGG